MESPNRQEVERKFLVASVPPAIERGSPEVIEQGYIAVDGDGTEVRVRRAGERRTLTVKSGRGLARAEVEFEISAAQFDALWPATAGRRVEKDRFRIDYQGATIELDVYRGARAGLLVAEVEFPSVESSAAFTAPDWFGREVTGESRYLNRNLALGS